MAKHAASADDVIILYVCVLIIEVGENRGNCICATLVNCLRVQTQGSVMRNDFLFIVRNYVHTYIHMERMLMLYAWSVFTIYTYLHALSTEQYTCVFHI